MAVRRQTKRTKTAGATSLPSRDDGPGERAVRFLNRLTHTGDYAGVPFDLRAWQAEPIRELFGTLRADGTRQYRKTFWALPRKQGKTEIVAGGGLFLLMGQGRTNQRIYTASGDVKQASLIFKAMCDMIRADPRLESLTVIYEGYKRIDYPRGNSSLEVLSSVPKSKHGLGPTAVLIDEYHVVDEELVNVLTTGFGARRDPLTWMITTAGWDRTSLCFDEWEYALKVRDGVIDDPTYLPVIHAADPEDDWTDERVWHKAMPALGDFCNVEFIREEFRKARERPRFENTFRQLYLNQWTEQASRWLQAERWKACKTLDAAELDGAECYGGLDLGVTGDMSALVRSFPNDRGGVDVLPRFWVPRDGRWRQEPRNKDLYPLWQKQGFLTFTDGETTDFDQVESDILAMNETTPFRMLCADRAYASHLLSRLFNNHGLPVEGIPQGPITLNEPMTRLEAMILDEKIRHTDHPVLNWNVANAVTKKTSTGLMHLDKSTTTSRIDGLAALINSLAAWMRDAGESTVSGPVVSFFTPGRG
jgi:phage terminase large subunit-like protein